MSKVVVVDDSLVAREIISNMLNELEHEVVAQADDGENLMSIYEQNDVDFITIDMEMPKIDGITASKQLLSKYTDAKIIMITSILDKKRTTLALNYGVNCILQKPITKEKLEEAISSIRN